MSLDQELLAQIDRYKDIMQKDPNSREFLTLAELYRKLGVAEEATKILRDGLTRHPDYVEARLAMARVYLTQGQVEDATREFEEVIRQDTGNFVAYKLLGEIAMQKQDSEKAADRFGAAYRIKPDDPECKVMLDYIGKLLGRDLFAQYGAGTAVIPPKSVPKPAPPAPAATIAVAPEDEFGEFEEAEELEEISELEEEELEEEELEEDFSEPAMPEDIGEFEPIEDVIEEEPVMEAEEEIEEIEEFSDIEEAELEDIEEVSAEEFEEIEELEEIEEEPETVEEVEEEVVEEVEEAEDELVSQIFQELSDSKYTSDSDNGLDEGNEGELEELMGLLESEEAIEEQGGVGEEEPPELLETDENDLEGMIDLDGVPGMEELTDVEDIAEVEELPEEIEEIEEEVEELPEEVEEEIEEFSEGFDVEEEIEELPEELEEVEEGVEEIEQIEEEPQPEPDEEVEMIEEVEEEEKSSIFQDFGRAGEEEEPETSAEGDVFQDFDFDVFEQELLKETPSVGIIEDVETEESFEDVEEEAVTETEMTEEEAVIEEFESEEGGEEGELPSSSLAELYIKQDLFEEAMTIYQKLLKNDPANQAIKQVLEETKALQAYIEGRE